MHLLYKMFSVELQLVWWRSCNRSSLVVATGCNYGSVHLLLGMEPDTNSDITF
jgi:hypothetical protein